MEESLKARLFSPVLRFLTFSLKAFPKQYHAFNSPPHTQVSFIKWKLCWAIQRLMNATITKQICTNTYLIGVIIDTKFRITVSRNPPTFANYRISSLLFTVYMVSGGKRHPNNCPRRARWTLTESARLCCLSSSWLNPCAGSARDKCASRGVITEIGINPAQQTTLGWQDSRRLCDSKTADDSVMVALFSWLVIGKSWRAGEGCTTRKDLGFLTSGVISDYFTDSICQMTRRITWNDFSDEDPLHGCLSTYRQW